MTDLLKCFLTAAVTLAVVYSIATENYGPAVVLIVVGSSVVWSLWDD